MIIPSSPIHVAADSTPRGFGKAGPVAPHLVVYAPGPDDNAHLHTIPHFSQRLSTSSRTSSRNPVDLRLYRLKYLQHLFQQPITLRKDMTMVQAPPQAPVADASASPQAMQHGAGHELADQGQHGKAQKPTTAAQEIGKRDVHTASPNNTQSRLANKQARVLQPAIRRFKSGEASQTTSPKSQDPLPKSPTTASSKPVLVRGPSTKPDMKKKHHSTDKSTSPKLPPIESFSFQDILGSIGPEANASIDAIAEICGRSKMSLAAEHSSHRPPHSQLAATAGSPDASFLPARLEPVAEMGPDRRHTRSISRSLALTTGSAQNGDGLPGSPTAATSNVTSHTHTTTSGYGKAEDTSPSASASLIPQVLAWLRRSGSTTTNEGNNASGQDDGAMKTMHRLLNDTAETRL